MSGKRKEQLTTTWSLSLTSRCSFSGWDQYTLASFGCLSQHWPTVNNQTSSWSTTGWSSVIWLPLPRWFFSRSGSIWGRKINRELVNVQKKTTSHGLHWKTTKSSRKRAGIHPKKLGFVNQIKKSKASSLAVLMMIGKILNWFLLLNRILLSILLEICHDRRDIDNPVMPTNVYFAAFVFFAITAGFYLKWFTQTGTC